MLKDRSQSPDGANVIALKALGFLASEPERLERFMTLTGLSPQAIRKQATEPQFLAGVLDYVLADQTLLLLFAEWEGLNPEAVVRARRQLPGAAVDF
ncbi:MAG: DUF3572 domain-containing protein [Albidovulum sp.]